MFEYSVTPQFRGEIVGAWFAMPDEFKLSHNGHGKPSPYYLRTRNNFYPARRNLLLKRSSSVLISSLEILR